MMDRRTTALASLALLALGGPLPPASALDPDCVQDGTPSEPYTGYSLKIGGKCAQYVYCMDGTISSWLTCPNNLKFNGRVGMDGICDWPGPNNKCWDPDLPENGGKDLGIAGQAPGPLPEPATNVVQQAAQQPASQAESTPNIATQQAQTQAQGGASGDGGWNPGNNYCGRDREEAKRLCIPCPKGEVTECANDLTHGCFRDVTECAVRDNGLVQGGGYRGDAYQGEAVQGDASPGNSPGNSPGSSPGNPPGNPLAPQQPNPSPVVGNPQPTLGPYSEAPFNPTPSGGDKTVIGYYASWQWYDREKLADPQNIDFRKYDRINFAFFQPDPDGYLYGTDEWADPQLLWGPIIWDSTPQDQYFCSWDRPNDRGGDGCKYYDTSKGILHLARAAGAEVVPSIGGWTLSDNFPGIAADPWRRNNFAQECVKLINAYGFDGIDIDWEYPGYEDHSGTPADTVNFTLLLQAIRDALDDLQRQTGKFYPLTAALPCGPVHLDKIQVNKVKDILTELNLMSYDLHGSWDALTGVNAPMYNQGWTDKSKGWSVHGCVERYRELGAPLSKMNMGLPFYGRSFAGAKGMKQFHDGADDVNFHLDEGSPQYFNIMDQLPKMTTYRHEKTQTQYAVFDGSKGGLVSYDDPRAICDKVEYANDRGMHGFLIWEISGDMVLKDGVVHTPLIDVTNAKIQQPGLQCSTLHDPIWALKDDNYRYAPPEPATVDWSQYKGPMGGGSGNDFDGAQESVPPDAYGDGMGSSKNSVYVPDGGGRGKDDDGEKKGKKDEDDCPPGFTGYFPVAGCGKYAYCQAGAVVGKALPCSPGTLFDVSIGVCTWEETVRCGSKA